MADVHWIASKATLDLLDGTDALIERLAAGMIRANAKGLHVELKYFQNVEFECTFWDRSDGSEFAADWQAGHFSKRLDGREIKALDVSFDLEGVLQLLPFEDRAITAHRLSVAGSKDWLRMSDAVSAISNCLHCTTEQASSRLVQQAQLGFVAARAISAEGCSPDLSKWNWSLNEREWDIPQWFWRWEGYQKELALHLELNTWTAKGPLPRGWPAEIWLTGVYILRRSLGTLGIGLSDEDAELTPRQHLPPISQSALEDWWSRLAKVRDVLTQDQLLILAQGQHPSNTVSRERIRDLTGPRKTGPK